MEGFQTAFHKRSCTTHVSSIWNDWSQFNCLSFLPALLILLLKRFTRKLHARIWWLQTLCSDALKEMWNINFSHESLSSWYQVLYWIFMNSDMFLNSNHSSSSLNTICCYIYIHIYIHIYIYRYLRHTGARMQHESWLISRSKGLIWCDAEWHYQYIV
jgi:hypothetical protein